MRIMFLSHGRNLGGAERCLAEAAHGLLRRGHEVSVVVPHEGDLAPLLRGYGATVFVIPSRWWMHNRSSSLPWPRRLKYALSNLQASYQISRAAANMNCQVIITNSLTVATASLAAKFCRLPHIWYVHEFGERDHRLVFDLGARFSFWLIERLSDKVIVNSAAVYQFVEQFIPKSKLALVYYAVEVAMPQLRATLPSAFNLVMVAHIAPGKGQHEAVEALSILRSKGLNIELTLVGAEHFPDYAAQIRQLIEQRGLRDAVHMTGYTPAPLPYLSAADVVVVCSSNEAFGRVTVEAMKLAKPVIGAAAAGTAELIEPGVTGLLYRSGDIAELAEKIAYLYDNPRRGAELGWNGQQWAASRFTTDRYVADLEAIIGEAVAPVNRSGPTAVGQPPR